MFASPRLAAVADGVGGAAAGEVASQAVINALVNLDKCRLDGRLEDALASAVGHGNDTIAFIAECRPQTAGMSTTLTALALADEGDYALVNIGDSRTYLLRDGELTRLTRDDSFVQELLDGGHLTEEQARTHPQRSLVLRALDGSAREPAAVTTFAACGGDRLLLCSDGLSDALGDGEIAAALSGGRVRRAPGPARAGGGRARQRHGRRRRRGPASRAIAGLELALAAARRKPSPRSAWRWPPPAVSRRRRGPGAGRRRSPRSVAPRSEAAGVTARRRAPRSNRPLPRRAAARRARRGAARRRRGSAPPRAPPRPPPARRPARP